MFHKLVDMPVEQQIKTLESLFDNGFGMFGFHTCNELHGGVKQFVVSFNEQSVNSKVCVDGVNVYCVALFVDHTDDIREAVTNCKEYMMENGLSEAVW